MPTPTLQIQGRSSKLGDYVTSLVGVPHTLGDTVTDTGDDVEIMGS